MFQTYLSIFNTFYENAIKNHRYCDLLSATVQRFLIFQTQQIDRFATQSSQKHSSLKNIQIEYSPISKQIKIIKKLFFSNQYETVLLFYAFFKMLQQKSTGNIHELLLKIKSRLGIIPEAQLRNKYQAKLSKFMITLSFLKERIQADAPVHWIYLQVFKQFQADTLLTAQLLSAHKNHLPSRQQMKNQGYSQLLKQLNATCYVFDYVNKSLRNQGQGQMKLYFGCRMESFFVLTQEQFAKYDRVYGSKAKGKHKEEHHQEKRSNSEGELYNKEQVMGEFMKMRKLYQKNTAIMATLFDFKDSDQLTHSSPKIPIE